jgi:hypothetical protein
MLFLRATIVDGSVQLSLSTTRPHPSNASWDRFVSLDSFIDLEALAPNAPRRSSVVIQRAGDRVLLSSVGHRKIRINRVRADIGKLVVEKPTAVRHRMDLDMTGRGIEAKVTHTLNLIDASGTAHPLGDHQAESPAFVQALRDWAGLPTHLEVYARHARGTERVAPQFEGVLSSYFALTERGRSDLEKSLRATREADRDLDNAKNLMAAMRVALSHYAVVVEHRPQAVEAVLSHSLGTALITVTTSARPALLTLQATLPTPSASATPTSTSTTFSRVDGFVDLVRNVGDVKSGVEAVDDAFIIRGDAAVAAAVAGVIGDGLVALGRGASVHLEGQTLQITATCTDPHPGVYATITSELAALWEALLGDW